MNRSRCLSLSFRFVSCESNKMHASGGVLIQPPGPRFFHQPRFHGIQHQPRGPHVFKFRPRLNASGQPEDLMGTTYDGKRIRKAIYRKTIDYNTAAANYVEVRQIIQQFSVHFSRPVAFLIGRILTLKTEVDRDFQTELLFTATLAILLMQVVLSERNYETNECLVRFVESGLAAGSEGPSCHRY